LIALESLNLANTQVASLEPLAGFTALEALNLSDLRVAGLEPLERLAALRTLDLAGTQVPSLEPLYDLPYLHLRNTESIPADVLERYIQYRKARRLPYP